jgi:hypothetical protein
MGHGVNRKRVQGLMRQIGLSAIAPGPNTSRPHPEHKVYRTLLRGRPVTRRNQVWSTDITTIRLARGFATLLASNDGNQSHEYNDGEVGEQRPVLFRPHRLILAKHLQRHAPGAVVNDRLGDVEQHAGSNGSGNLACPFPGEDDSERQRQRITGA